VILPDREVIAEEFVVDQQGMKTREPAQSAADGLQQSDKAESIEEAGVVVYVKPDCTCSATAIKLIESHGIKPTILPFEDSPDANRENEAKAPIVWIDGRARFFGKVDAMLLRRALHNRSLQNHEPSR